MIVNNPPSKLYYSNVIIQRGVLVVWVDICLLHLYQFSVWCVVSNCINFYLKLKRKFRYFKILF